MAQFLDTQATNNALYDLIREAKSVLILVSPFIKLHPVLKSLLIEKRNELQLKLIIVFGKNKEDISKSLAYHEVLFLQSFPCVEIRYQENLHAKYYANEKHSILTSMNLYDYSQEHNIEFGILTKIQDSEKELDQVAYQYFTKVVQESHLIYKKEKTDPQSVVNKTMLFYPEASEHPNSEKPPQMQGAYLREPQLAFQAYSQQHYGYCIRTGVKIPFNPQLPMSTTAYEIWQRFENQHYPEFYCHFTGEDSFGQTSFGQPILKKNRMHAFTYLKGIE